MKLDANNALIDFAGSKIKRFCEWLLPTARSDHESASTAGLRVSA